MWEIVLIVFLLLFALFDIPYVLRAVVSYLQSIYLRRKSRVKNVLEESIMTGMCSFQDLDIMWHMNNARYLRECDFGRIKLYSENGVMDAVRLLKGHVTMGASTIRYRKSLQLWDRFQIRTKILCWDERAFYLEQRMERSSDAFVCAIAFIKQTLLKITPQQVVDHLAKDRHGAVSPQMPSEIAKFVECHQISSENMKKAC